MSISYNNYNTHSLSLVKSHRGVMGWFRAVNLEICHGYSAGNNWIQFYLEKDLLREFE